MRASSKWSQGKKRRAAKRAQRAREAADLASKLAGGPSYTDLRPVTAADKEALAHIKAILQGD